MSTNQDPPFELVEVMVDGIRVKALRFASFNVSVQRGGELAPERIDTARAMIRIMIETLQGTEYQYAERNIGGISVVVYKSSNAKEKTIQWQISSQLG